MYAWIIGGPNFIKQTPLDIKGQIDHPSLFLTKNQERDFRGKMHHRSNGFHSHFQNISTNSFKMHILLSSHGILSKINHT
jgi:hypothetical protein